MAKQYDAIVVGAGHNGLVAACYLARGGLRVLVLERRPVPGGACVTEEIFPGYKVSTAAYVQSLFRLEIVRELELWKYGYALLAREPHSFTPLPDGRFLLLGSDPELNRREIGKFSSSDAERYPAYEAMLDRIAGFVEPLLTQTPPNLMRPRFRDLRKLFYLGGKFLALGPGIRETLRLLTGAARPILESWFDSEPLKATLATDSVIGAMASPSSRGTAYVLLHHVMGRANGKRGVWGYVCGGMGTLTQALAAAARERGAQIRCEAGVTQILVRDRSVQGVVLASGEEISAPIVASNADAYQTFLRLMEPRWLPPDFVEKVRRIDYSSGSLKINLALAQLPSFTSLPGTRPGPQHRGTIHICPDMDYLERAFQEAKSGHPSSRPVLECTIPSVVDPSVAPPGKHLMSIFVQYAPYALGGATWEDLRGPFADRCIDLLAEYAPNLKRAVLHRQVLSPVDLERVFGLTGGNIFQGAMSPDQLFWSRPVAGYADYRTPVRGLYLCGAAAHPGGGVIGAAGYNAAREILGAYR